MALVGSQAEPFYGLCSIDSNALPVVEARAKLELPERMSLFGR
jgi:hypothetical protein